MIRINTRPEPNPDITQAGYEQLIRVLCRQAYRSHSRAEQDHCFITLFHTLARYYGTPVYDDVLKRDLVDGKPS